MKRVLSVILSLVMLMSLVSVTALADEAKQGGTLTVGEYILDTQMSNKNPYVTNGTWNSNLRTLIYDALVYYNPLSGEYSPVLAEEWSWND
ncbi:MAG: hypothetical protein RSG96_06810, partial [Clostridia bacterium]